MRSDSRTKFTLDSNFVIIIQIKFKPIDVIDIDDFPKYEIILEIVQKKITFGSYKTKMSFSYMYLKKK